MKREISVTPEIMEQLAFQNTKSGNSNDARIQRMKKIMNIAMENELTQRQRDCIRMRYFENIPVKEIAEKIGICPATVYKHISRAIRIFRKCAVYL